MSALPSQPARKKTNGIDVSLSDRWLILGTTGTGKTTYDKELIKQLQRLYDNVPLYILDSKGDDDFIEWWNDTPGLVQTDEPPKPIESGVQVWQPGIDNPAAYDAWCDMLLHAPGPAIILFDEISSLKSSNSNQAPPGFQRLMKQGRSKLKCVINNTQEMAYNPRQIITQTTHAVRFRMGGAYDQRESNKLLRRNGTAPEPSQVHGFFYRRMDRVSDIVEYASYKDFF